MILSAPIFRLRRNAKLLSRQSGIPLHQALNSIAAEEGFSSWSHLSSSYRQAPSATSRILDQLSPGDVVLLGARPAQGKTLLGLELLADHIKRGNEGFFFTLDYTHHDVVSRLTELNADLAGLQSGLVVDTSDAITAAHIKTRCANHNGMLKGAIVVVDYMQLLDQRRTTPILAEQLETLQRFARKSGIILILISQISRDFEESKRQLPNWDDIRRTNPVPSSLFSHAIFLHEGQVDFGPLN